MKSNKLIVSLSVLLNLILLGISGLLDLYSLVKNFIFSSTAAVYKDGIFKVKENSPLKPKSVYGKTKLKAEKLIKSNLKKNILI